MPYRICKSFEIESGHQLAKHPEKCRFPHGHTRKVEFTLEADDLDENDMVCDFKAVKLLIHEFLDGYDHALCMNTDDPEYSRMKAAYGERIIGFTHRDPTTEVLAETIFTEFEKRLSSYSNSAAETFPVRPSVRIVSVRVWETTSSWAEFCR